MLSVERTTVDSWLFGSMKPPRIYQAQLFKTSGDHYTFVIGRLLPEPFIRRWPTYINEVYHQSFYSRDFPEEVVTQMASTFASTMDPDYPYELAGHFGGTIVGDQVRISTGGYDA